MKRIRWQFTSAPRGERTRARRMLSLQKETGVRLFVDPHPVNHSRAETVRWLRALPETRGMAEVERIPYCQTNVEIASLLAKISRITVREHGLAIVVC